MTEAKKLSAKSIAADCYDLLAIPEARSTILGLARRAHELDTGDEETPPLIDRQLDRNHPEECAAWCIALVRYFHRDWEYFPQLYEPEEEIGTGPSESARVSVAVFDSYVDDWLSARADSCRDLPAAEHEDGSTSADVDPSMLAVQRYWLLPERLRQNTNAILSVLRARLDEWGSQFEIDPESPQNNDQPNDTLGQGSGANGDEAFGEAILGTVNRLIHEGSKRKAVLRVNSLMNEMLDNDFSRIEWTLLDWAKELRAGKTTIHATDAWKAIKRKREARKQLAQSRAEISNSAARAKQGRKTPAAKPKD